VAVGANTWNSRSDTVTPMGHNYGRDNVKKRARRRKKTERLVIAKKNKTKKAK
jgi:hypothetical protein